MQIPRHYQEIGSKWLAETRRGYLADEMGIGKTLQASYAAELAGAERIAVIGPAIARPNWVRHWKVNTVFDRLSLPYTGPGVCSIVGKRGAITASFDGTARADAGKAMKAWRPDTVIIDETHYLKDRGAKRTQAIFGKDCDGIGGLIEHAERVFLLSGTPCPNNASELWTWLHAFGHYPGKYWTFVNEYCLTQQTRFGTKIIGNNPTTLPRLKELLSRCMLRRTVAEVMPELPPLSVETVTIDGANLSSDEDVLSELRRAEPEAARALADAIAHGDMQLADVPHTATIRRLIGLAKAPATVELATTILDSDPGEKVVIFASHHQVIDAIKSRLEAAGHRVGVIIGGQSDAARTKAMHQFQTDPRHRVIIGQIKAASTAVDLFAARRLLICEPDWTPGNNLQAIKRVSRLGQTRPVLAEYVALAGSIDERITAILAHKTREIAQLFS
jgi:SWI/SNF-related matrix-associated actin-dependent regulator of chromatin subfamily A-like protein 1